VARSSRAARELLGAIYFFNMDTTVAHWERFGTESFPCFAPSNPESQAAVSRSPPLYLLRGRVVLLVPGHELRDRLQMQGPEPVEPASQQATGTGGQFVTSRAPGDAWSPACAGTATSSRAARR